VKVFSGQFSIQTSKQIELVNISSEIDRVISRSGVADGLTTVYSPHTTTGIIINENEGRLVRDIEASVKEIIPWDKDYGHNSIDDNAPAHIAGAILGCGVTVPIAGGRLELGTWQSIFLVELDGPRQREIKVKIVGD
jgi:secondary thiamine-phosphate synthase enzyme